MIAARPLMQLAVLVILQLWLPTTAIERAVSDTPKTHSHHHSHAHETEVALDKRGNSIVRGESKDLHQDAFHSIKHSHHKQTHRMSDAALAPEVLLREGPPNGGEDLDSWKVQQAADLRNYQPGHAVVPVTDIAQAEAEEQKLDTVIRAAEEKAGLPDSTKTTPEPQSMEPSNAEQEGNALMIAAISLVVIIGSASAGWSIWVARKAYAKTNGGGDALLEGEGEYAADDGEGEVAEAQGEEAEGEAVEAK